MKAAFERDNFLREAAFLIEKSNFTKEDSSRASLLMDLADRVGASANFKSNYESRERQALTYALRNGELRESRTLGIATPTQSTAVSVLAKEGFWDRLTTALKAFDALFRDDVVTIIETDTGAPTVLPNLDDTAAAATPITENTQEGASEPVTSAVVLGVPPTYRSGIVRVSVELMADSAFDPGIFLSLAFAIRMARGISPTLVASLLASAHLGRTAAGSSANTGGSETGGTSVGWLDLIMLRTSVNPAYRATEKTGWLMNDNTLAFLDGTLNKYGAPLFPQLYDGSGRRLLNGFPVYICPSMPDIGLNAKPILFGALGFFVVRLVKGATNITQFNERFAEYGQVGFHSVTRANGGLLAAGGADSPVKFLQNAAA